MQKKIAVTGGIGSGKSLAMAYIAELGYPIFSCDAINKELLTDPEYIEKIGNFFPTCVKDGKIDKTLLKAVVFADCEELKKLNALAHPIIMKRLFSAMERSESALAFAEVPLLFEGGYERFFDDIIVIKRNLEDRINAVYQRDGLAKEELEKRIAAQIDYDHIKNHIENLRVYIIENEENDISLKNKIIETIAHLK